MKPKLTELEKLKLWLDTEITILHIMFAVVMFQVTEGWIWGILLTVYIIYCVIYLFRRVAKLAVDDPNYLKVDK